MLKLTDLARQFVSQTLAGTPPGTVVRLIKERGQLKMMLDRHRPGDFSFQHKGQTILVFDSAAANRLRDQTLDLNPQGALSAKPD